MAINIDKQFQKMKNVQESLLEYIECDDFENGFIPLETTLNEQQIQENFIELIATLHLLVKIANNHHRSQTFFLKIEKILRFLKTSISENFSNFQIYTIFQSNKRILLFLFEEKILMPDISTACSILSDKYIERNYHAYFYLEFEDFFKQLKNRNDFKYEEIHQFYEKNKETFEHKRKIGENDDYICTLIQNDSVEEFIQYVNKTNLSLRAMIKPSIFETNSFLIKRKSTNLIEYSAFFGSIQIFKYLYLNNVELTQFIWLYVIHSQNPDLIHFIEEQRIQMYGISYTMIFNESIKCHHNNFSEYIQNNYLNHHLIFNDFPVAMKYYNFLYFPNEINCDFNSFYNLCKNDHISIVDSFLQNMKFDINTIHISKNIVFSYKDEIKKLNNFNKKTALAITIEKGNLEIVKLLLKLEKIDVNLKSILTNFFNRISNAFIANYVLIIQLF